MTDRSRRNLEAFLQGFLEDTENREMTAEQKAKRDAMIDQIAKKAKASGTPMDAKIAEVVLHHFNVSMFVMNAQLTVWTFARQEMSFGTEPEKIEKFAKEILRGMVNGWWRGLSAGFDEHIMPTLRESVDPETPLLNKLLNDSPEDLRETFFKLCKELIKEIAPQLFEIGPMTTALSALAEQIKNDMPDVVPGDEWKKGTDYEDEDITQP